MPYDALSRPTMPCINTHIFSAFIHCLSCGCNLSSAGLGWERGSACYSLGDARCRNVYGVHSPMQKRAWYIDESLKLVLHMVGEKILHHAYVFFPRRVT